jgi:hypothetical protein
MRCFYGVKLWLTHATPAVWAGINPRFATAREWIRESGLVSARRQTLFSCIEVI